MFLRVPLGTDPRSKITLAYAVTRTLSLILWVSLSFVIQRTKTNSNTYLWEVGILISVMYFISTTLPPFALDSYLTLKLVTFYLKQFNDEDSGNSASVRRRRRPVYLNQAV